MPSEARASGYRTSLEHVLAEVARLDLLLREQIFRMRRRGGEAGDGLAAFVIRDAEVDAALGRRVGTPPWGGSGPVPREDVAQVDAEIAARTAASLRDGVFLRLVALAGMFGLASIDVDIVVICLAPELDRRYERMYGYLQDDVTRRLPTVDLILNLVCPDIEAKVETGRVRFSPDAPLVRRHLIVVEDDSARFPCSLLDRGVRLEPRVAAFLLDDDQVDARLARCATLVTPTRELAELVFPAEFGMAVANLAAHPGDDLVIYCHGPAGVGKRSVAEACCQEWHLALLVVDCVRLAACPADEFDLFFGLVDREARLQGASVYWDNVDSLLADERRTRLDVLISTSAANPAPAFLAGDTEWEPSGLPDTATFIGLEFPSPGHRERLRLWRAELSDVDIDPGDLEELSGTFRLSGGQIRDAVATARTLARVRDPLVSGITQDDLRTACRLRSNRKLGALARRITPRCHWDDLVLPEDRMALLREMYDQVRYRATVYESWGFERKVTSLRGVSALFAGPPGTGKTMAADVLANALDMDLYKINLAAVVSKYIGETEKNLGRIFDEATTSNAVLFFDEADALFGKRTQVRDAHDRYANLETSYLLQRMEDHEGVVVLATNLRKNMDDAFVRRLAFAVDFPIPDAADRLRIWTRIWPPDTPRDALDLELLARQIDLPGGNIRNIAVAGSFLAAAGGGTVTMAHLARAARREYQKIGKVRAQGDFGADPGTPQ